MMDLAVRFLVAAVDKAWSSLVGEQRKAGQNARSKEDESPEEGPWVVDVKASASSDDASSRPTKNRSWRANKNKSASSSTKGRGGGPVFVEDRDDYDTFEKGDRYETEYTYHDRMDHCAVGHAARNHRKSSRKKKAKRILPTPNCRGTEGRWPYPETRQLV